jgi:hypothetical protein
MEGSTNGITPISTVTTSKTTPTQPPRGGAGRGGRSRGGGGGGGRGVTNGFSFQGSSNNNDVEIPVRCLAQTDPGVYCGQPNYTDARW